MQQRNFSKLYMDQAFIIEHRDIMSKLKAVIKHLAELSYLKRVRLPEI